MEQKIWNEKKYFVLEKTEAMEMENVALGMLEQNEMQCLLPFRLMRHDREQCFRYEAESGIPLKEWMSNVHDKKEILEVLEKVAQMEEELESYLMEPDHLCTQAEFILLNEKQCRMAYIPVVDYREGKLLGVVQYILNGVNYALDEDYAYIYDLLNAFSRGDIQNCTELKKWVRMLAQGEKLPQPKTEPEAILPQESVEMAQPESKKRFFFGHKKKAEKQEEPEPFAVDKVWEPESTPPPMEKYYNELKDTDATVFLQEEKQGWLIQKSTGREYPIEKESYVIGSGAKQSDIQIEYNAAISRKHARIGCVGEDCYLEDLDSTNGTWVNGEKVHAGERYPLTANARIKLANEEFVFEMRRK